MQIASISTIERGPKRSLPEGASIVNDGMGSARRSPRGDAGVRCIVHTHRFHPSFHPPHDGNYTVRVDMWPPRAEVSGPDPSRVAGLTFVAGGWAVAGVAAIVALKSDDPDVKAGAAVVGLLGLGAGLFGAALTAPALEPPPLLAARPTRQPRPTLGW